MATARNLAILFESFFLRSAKMSEIQIKFTWLKYTPQKLILPYANFNFYRCNIFREDFDEHSLSSDFLKMAFSRFRMNLSSKSSDEEWYWMFKCFKLLTDNLLITKNLHAGYCNYFKLKISCYILKRIKLSNVRLGHGFYLHIEPNFIRVMWICC